MQHTRSIPTNPDVHHVTLSIFAVLEGHLKCVSCGDALILTPANLLLEREFHVQCHCGMMHEIIMGQRRYARKATWLPGRYYSFDNTAITGEMTVEDISFGGICFRVQAPFNLNVGDRLHLDFTLDDTAENQIVVPVTVRNVWQDVIGVEFLRSETFNRELAAYLIK